MAIPKAACQFCLAEITDGEPHKPECPIRRIEPDDPLEQSEKDDRRPFWSDSEY